MSRYVYCFVVALLLSPIGALAAEPAPAQAPAPAVQEKKAEEKKAEPRFNGQDELSLADAESKDEDAPIQEFQAKKEGTDPKSRAEFSFFVLEACAKHFTMSEVRTKDHVGIKISDPKGEGRVCVKDIIAEQKKNNLETGCGSAFPCVEKRLTINMDRLGDVSLSLISKSKTGKTVADDLKISHKTAATIAKEEEEQRRKKEEERIARWESDANNCVGTRGIEAAEALIERGLADQELMQKVIARTEKDDVEKVQKRIEKASAEELEEIRKELQDKAADESMNHDAIADLLLKVAVRYTNIDKKSPEHYLGAKETVAELESMIENKDLKPKNKAAIASRIARSKRVTATHYAKALAQGGFQNNPSLEMALQDMNTELAPAVDACHRGEGNVRDCEETLGLAQQAQLIPQAAQQVDLRRMPQGQQMIPGMQPQFLPQMMQPQGVMMPMLPGGQMPQQPMRMQQPMMSPPMMMAPSMMMNGGGSGLRRF